MGDILDLRATLDRLKEDEPACTAFARQVKALADHYQIAEIKTFFELYQ